MRAKSEIMIVGRLPPPHGGVSVHLSRLSQYLIELNFPFLFCDLSGRSHPDRRIIRCRSALELIWNLIARSYGIVHCHASNPWLFLLIDFFVYRILRRKTIFTLHGEGILSLCENGPFILRVMLLGAFKRATRIITINSDCRKRALAFAGAPENVLLMPAYLPPPPSETVLCSYSDEIELFFKDHSICLASQGSFGSHFKGWDLYRFDLLAEALVRLRLTHPKAGLCTLVTQTLDQTAREAVFSLRSRLGLDRHWLILENFGVAVPVYLRCIAFIRPTMTDGDSMSIRECLDLGIPVIASDAVPRPEACLLFRSGDINSLFISLSHLINNYPMCRRKVQQSKTESCLPSLLACYQALLR